MTKKKRPGRFATRPRHCPRKMKEMKKKFVQNGLLYRKLSRFQVLQILFWTQFGDVGKGEARGIKERWNTIYKLYLVILIIYNLCQTLRTYTPIKEKPRFLHSSWNCKDALLRSQTGNRWRKGRAIRIEKRSLSSS